MAQDNVHIVDMSPSTCVPSMISKQLAGQFPSDQVTSLALGPVQLSVIGPVKTAPPDFDFLPSLTTTSFHQLLSPTTADNQLLSTFAMATLHCKSSSVSPCVCHMYELLLRTAPMRKFSNGHVGEGGREKYRLPRYFLDIDTWNHDLLPTVTSIQPCSSSSFEPGFFLESRLT